MTDEEEARSELFLTCDLVGSTALKQRPGAEWEQVFLAFYIDFPSMLGQIAEKLDIPFRLWKPIGDELVFRVVVTSELEIAKAVRAWLEALAKYESDESFRRNAGGLLTKGGAFLATFPGPDVEAGVVRDPTKAAPDGLGLAQINAHALEAKDPTSYIYDFFGPSFDTGFRVISKASPRHFTLSVEVAWAVMRADGDCPGEDTLEDVVYLGPTELKGVWGGRNYPLFAIDRHFDDDVNKVMAKLNGDSLDKEGAMAVAERCVMSKDLPTRLYLPNSSSPIAQEIPVSAVRRLTGTATSSGLETETDELSGKPLPVDASFGDEEEPVAE